MGQVFDFSGPNMYQHFGLHWTYIWTYGVCSLITKWRLASNFSFPSFLGRGLATFCKFKTVNIAGGGYLDVVIGRVGLGFRFKSGQVSLTFWKKLGQGRVGSDQFICCVFFFRFLIDFDWIEDLLISGRVRVRSGQFIYFFKSDRVGFESGWIGRISRSGRILPPLRLSRLFVLSNFQHYTT
jgi:hypothetical protein